MSDEAVHSDVKELLIAGCRVRLAYIPAGAGRWKIRCTMRWGIDANRGEQSLVTGIHGSREEAEQAAISQLSGLLGQQVDRSHSPTHNWDDV